LLNDEPTNKEQEEMAIAEEVARKFCELDFRTEFIAKDALVAIEAVGLNIT
jgi:DUF1009 family protein